MDAHPRSAICERYFLVYGLVFLVGSLEDGDMKKVGRQLSNMFTEMQKLNDNLGITQGDGGNTHGIFSHDLIYRYKAESVAIHCYFQKLGHIPRRDKKNYVFLRLP